MISFKNLIFCSLVFVGAALFSGQGSLYGSEPSSSNLIAKHGHHGHHGHHGGWGHGGWRGGSVWFGSPGYYYSDPYYYNRYYYRGYYPYDGYYYYYTPRYHRHGGLRVEIGR